MKNTQQIEHDKSVINPGQLAQMGMDDYAYLRSVDIADLAEKFEIRELEEISRLSPQSEIWVLFSADGMPLAMGTDAAELHMQADELDLDPVFLH